MINLGRQYVDGSEEDLYLWPILIPQSHTAEGGLLWRVSWSDTPRTQVWVLMGSCQVMASLWPKWEMKNATSTLFYKKNFDFPIGSETSHLTLQRFHALVVWGSELKQAKEIDPLQNHQHLAFPDLSQRSHYNNIDLVWGNRWDWGSLLAYPGSGVMDSTLVWHA